MRRGFLYCKDNPSFVDFYVSKYFTTCVILMVSSPAGSFNRLATLYIGN